MQKKNNFVISAEYEMQVRKTRSAFLMDCIDWDRLKEMIRKIQNDNLWSNAYSASFSAAISTGLTYFSIDKSNWIKTYLFSLTWIFLAIGTCSFIFDQLQKRSNGSTKQDILDELKRIEDSNIISN